MEPLKKTDFDANNKASLRSFLHGHSIQTTEKSDQIQGGTLSEGSLQLFKTKLSTRTAKTESPKTETDETGAAETKTDATEIPKTKTEATETTETKTTETKTVGTGSQETSGIIRRFLNFLWAFITGIGNKEGSKNDENIVNDKSTVGNKAAVGNKSDNEGTKILKKIIGALENKNDYELKTSLDELCKNTALKAALVNSLIQGDSDLDIVVDLLESQDGIAKILREHLFGENIVESYRNHLAKELISSKINAQIQHLAAKPLSKSDAPSESNGPSKPTEEEKQTLRPFSSLQLERLRMSYMHQDMQIKKGTFGQEQLVDTKQKILEQEKVIAKNAFSFNEKDYGSLRQIFESNEATKIFVLHLLFLPNAGDLIVEISKTLGNSVPAMFFAKIFEKLAANSNVDNLAMNLQTVFNGKGALQERADFWLKKINSSDCSSEIKEALTSTFAGAAAEVKAMHE